MFYTPLALSAMYQLTIHGGTAMMAIATASLLIFTVGTIVFLTWRIMRAAARRLLFDEIATLLKYGTLYNTLFEEGTLFFLVNLLVRFLWGLSIAMLSSYGIVQISVLLAVELGYMLVIGFKWPFSESGDNKFHLLLSFMRIIITGCSVAYLHEMGAGPELKQLIGYIQICLHLSVLIVMLALILWNTIQVILLWRSRHRRIWKGRAKRFGHEDPVEDGDGWIVSSRSRNRQSGSVLVNSPKPRRFTVEPYSSITTLQSPIDEDFARHRSSFRQTIQPAGFHQARFPLETEPSMTLDLRSEAMPPLSNSPGPLSARTISPAPLSPTNESMDGSVIPLQPTQLSTADSQPSPRQPPAESYAKIQRMTHQQGIPDFRNRRMSDIFRDGGYLYNPNRESGSNGAGSSERQSTWRTMKESIGGIFARRGSDKKPDEENGKPKAFEVMRPRPPPAESTDDASIAGEDNLRELSSLGISRFFQESGRNNEQKRNLFVANPEAMASQTASQRSSLSGVPPVPFLQRSPSSTTSVHTPGYRPRSSQNLTGDQHSIRGGMGFSRSDIGYSNSPRGSVLSTQPTYPRNSVESNIAEALRSETTLKLHDGGILKVSKGPEKAIQYWHKESGQYVGSSAQPSTERRQNSLPVGTPPLIFLPTSRGSIFDTIHSESSNRAAPSIKSRVESRPESPTDSHPSNVAISAGKMHEILDRMFSDQDEEDDESDVVSEGDESCSTFSGRVSATILALHQKREQEELADGQSLYRLDTLEPLLERSGSKDGEGRKSSIEGSSRSGVRRATSISSRGRPGTLVRTFSGPASQSASPSASATSLLLRHSKSGSLSRPLAQTPLHSPSVLPFSGSTISLNHPGSQSGQLSRDGSFTVRQGATEPETDADRGSILDPLREEPATTSSEPPQQPNDEH
ncbi:MAG: hypothetical protein J3Q66DRAFT_334993 [Benniella sp.]|nr:MAG: hypothetical protein J3Q66DRAFT_334993 [Benniella sp.]